MEAYEDWCNAKSNDLLKDETRLSTLNEIKEQFATFSKDEKLRAAKNLQLTLVFDCLNASNRDQINAACEVLSLCFNVMNSQECMNKYEIYLERALTHPQPDVKLMALNEFDRNVKLSNDFLFGLSKKTSLLMSIFKCLSCRLQVAKKATEILTAVGQKEFGINQLTCEELIKCSHEVMEVNNIVSLRVYELFIDVSVASEYSLNRLDSTGLMRNVLQELQNDDVLVQLNVVELLSRLVTTKHGYTYLETNKVFDALFTLMKSELTADICGPGVMKFFGLMAYSKPLEVLSKYPQLYDHILNNIKSSNPTLVGIAMDTLGLISLSNEGKIALDSKSNKIEDTIKHISHLSQFPDQLRVRGLNCIENLLRIKDFDSKVSKICKEWFEMLGDNPIETIMKYVNNPINELCNAGLSNLKAIANHPWGQDVINNTPGLIELLLDRNFDCDKLGKEIKFEIILMLAHSPVFNQHTLKRLQTYAQQGPFYVQRTTQVATRGND